MGGTTTSSPGDQRATTETTSGTWSRVAGRSRRILGEHAVETLFVGVVLLGFIASPNFLTTFNVNSILQQAAVLGILAVGQAVVIISGGFDLSVGSVVALSTMVTASTIAEFGLLSIPVAVLAGGAMGAVSGLAVTWARIPPFVATLAVLGIARGLAFTIDNQGIVISDAQLVAFHAAHVGPVPLVALVWLAIVVLVHLLLRFTRTGTHWYAVGGNLETARLAGVPVARVQLKAYLLSGCLAGLAGVLFAARSSSGSPGIAAGWELDSIAVVVIGGVSLLGGAGNVLRVALGVLIYLMLANVMNLVNVDTYLQNVLKAVLILSAVTIPLFVQRRGQARRAS
ncbi:ABC transporter permease [Promicromonospora umidemergens]